MRSERQMFDLILGVAKNDERVRAVYMNGSRTNPNAPKDIFQDYDIVYVVTETAPFIADDGWLDVFGERLMMQEPDKLGKGIGREVDFARSYAYLMLFRDGNRIDLRLETPEAALERYVSDSLTVPLLDKDGLLPPIPATSDADYVVQRPTEAEFACCTNDFWWCLQNVGKGIWRKESPYARRMFEETTRVSLDRMVSWWIGMKCDFQVSAGKMGKYFQRYLPEHYYRLYAETYVGSDYELIWQAIEHAGDLFRVLGQEVAEHFSFVYPIEDDNNMVSYLLRVRETARDAKELLPGKLS